MRPQRVGADEETNKNKGKLSTTRRRGPTAYIIFFVFIFISIKAVRKAQKYQFTLHHRIKKQASTIKKRDRISMPLPRFRNQASGVFFDKRSS